MKLIYFCKSEPRRLSQFLRNIKMKYKNDKIEKFKSITLDSLLTETEEKISNKHHLHNLRSQNQKV